MFYKQHIFLCNNKKSDETGCGYIAYEDARQFMKTYLQALDLWGENKVRVSQTGCLGRCSIGPTCVIYPEGIWYTYVDANDLKEIIDIHIRQDQIVNRLLL